MANIGIIGYGFVGRATAHSFNTPSNRIAWYDKFKEEDAGQRSVPLERLVEDSEFLFVCLPTESVFDPQHPRIDLRIMAENIDLLTRYTDGTDKVVIIKSTIVPGTTNSYEAQHPQTRFCFNPEFLTEANYLHDATHPDRIVIGASNDLVSRRVTVLYRDRFGESVPIYRTDPTTAELVKYMANCFLATKVIFANEMEELCRSMSINYEQVKEMVAADSRIGSSHLDITTLRGFGGKCFPKDLAALIGEYDKHGLDPSLLRAVWEKNLRIRKKGPDNRYDWEHIPGVVSKAPGSA